MVRKTPGGFRRHRALGPTKNEAPSARSLLALDTPALMPEQNKLFTINGTYSKDGKLIRERVKAADKLRVPDVPQTILADHHSGLPIYFCIRIDESVSSIHESTCSTYLPLRFA